MGIIETGEFFFNCCCGHSIDNFQSIIQHHKHFLTADRILRGKHILAYAINDTQALGCQQVFLVIGISRVGEVLDFIRLSLFLCVDLVSIHQENHKLRSGQLGIRAEIILPFAGGNATRCNIVDGECNDISEESAE